MSDGSPGSRQWAPPPSFSNAPRGYWAHEVDGLLDDLKASDQAGELLDPIIDARELSEVAFGLDMAEVDAFLDSLRGEQAIGPTTTPEGNVPREDACQHAVPKKPMSATSPARETPTVHHIHQDTAAPRSRWRVRRSRKRAAMPVHRSAEMEAVLAEIDRAKYFPARRQPGQGHDQGYDVREVDRYFAGLAFVVQVGMPILPKIREHQFRTARTGSHSYRAAVVDKQLARVEPLALAYDNAAISRGALEAKPRRLPFWLRSEFLRSVPLSWFVLAALTVVVIVIFSLA